MAFFDFAVLIPRIGSLSSSDLLRQATQFDETHAALDQTTRKQALLAVGGGGGAGLVDAVELLSRGGFSGEVAEFGDGRLHAPGKFVV